MFTILGLLAILLPSLAEGKKVKGLCFQRYEQPKGTQKLSKDAKGKVFPIATKSDFESKYYSN